MCLLFLYSCHPVQWRLKSLTWSVLLGGATLDYVTQPGKFLKGGTINGCPGIIDLDIRDVNLDIWSPYF